MVCTLFQLTTLCLSAQGQRPHVSTSHRCLVALESALGMAGDTLVTLEHLYCAVRRAPVHLSSDVLARHRVAMAIDLDVVVDADPHHLSFGTQGRLSQLGEGAGAAWHWIRWLL